MSMSRPLTALRPIIASASASSSASSLPTTPSSTLIRHASSTSSSSPASTSTPQRTPLPLSWPDYLALRRSRRLWSTLTSVPSTLAGLTLGGGYFASIEADPTHLIMGIEPMFVYGGATLGCMALGYLLGPTIGSSLFSLTHPSISRGSPSPLEVMDRELFEHIKRNRVDPRFQSVSNLPPDYYGEKITSLKTYRRWLRDQATYMRKAKHGVPDEAE